MSDSEYDHEDIDPSVSTFGEYMGEMSDMDTVSSNTKQSENITKFQPINDDDDGEDEIVHRLPVFLSHELNESLYLLQYPLRPVDRPYSDVGELKGARFKPIQRRIELEYKMDTEGSHYNENADYDISSLKFTSHTIPPKSNYAIGSVRGDRVYITPLHAVNRMTPSLEHIDDAVMEDYIEAEKRKHGGMLPKDDEDDMRMVTQKMKRGDKSFSKKQTYHHIKTLQDMEEWIPVNLHSVDSSSSSHKLNQMSIVPSKTTQFPMSANEYLEYLHPFDDMFEIDTNMNIVGNTRFDVQERAKHFLRNSTVTSLKHLIEKLNIKSSEDFTSLLSVLKTHTQYIQGNFVCKSEVIYNIQKCKPNYKLVLARNFVLASFHRDHRISRGDISKHTGALSVQELTDILEEVSYRDGETEFWNFKYLPDDTFKELFPELEAEMSSATSRLYDFILDLLQPLKAPKPQ